MPENELIAFTDEGQKAIFKHLETLRVDLGASGVILFDQSGQLLSECGSHGALDINVFLSLLGNAMVASNEVVHLLRDEAAFDLHLYEGKTFDLHTARINDRIFLTMISERHAGSSRVGMIWISLRRSVTELRTLIKHARVRTVSPESRKIKTAANDVRIETLAKTDTAPRPPASGETDESGALKSARARRLKIGDIFAARPASEPIKRAVEPPPQETKPSANPTPLTNDFDWLNTSSDDSESTPSAPISPDLLDQPNNVLTYEQARALGLINLDDSDRAKK